LGVSVRKFNILENVLLFHWRAITVGLIFTMLSFLMWFFEEILELFFFSAFEAFLEQTFYLMMLSFLICSQIAFAYVALKGV